MNIDIARLPRRSLTTGTRLYRIHRRARDAWFFDGSSAGRFNPTDTPGRGACYWAEDPLGAWVEVFRTRMTLTEDDLNERCLSSVTISLPLVIADFTDRRALAAGVTAALAGGVDYRPAQVVANSLDDAGFAGVRWRVRHDLAQALLGVAWFGPIGSQHEPNLVGLPTPEQAPIPEDLVARACAEFGYRVLPDIR